MSFKLSNNSIPQGNTAGSQRGFLKTVGGSLINVGATIGAGAAVGGGIGKLASLTPYKPKAAELEYQFKDMFVKAAKNEEAPEHIRNLGDSVSSLVNSYKQLAKKTEFATNNCVCYNGCLEAVKKISEEEIKDKKFQTAIKKIIKGKMSENGYTKEQIVERLTNKIARTTNFLEKNSENANNILGDFCKKASANERMTELATKGAKHLRSKAIIGVGIGVGIISALVLNILKTYGVLKLPKLGKNQAQQNPLPNGVSPEMIAKLQQMQAAQGAPQAAK